MALDTTVFEQKEFRAAINKLEELLSHSKAVLLGAGTSFCAGLPLTNQLTERALISNKLSDDSKQCSGSMIPDTQIGGNLTIKEVFNDKKTTSIIHSRIQV